MAIVVTARQTIRVGEPGHVQGDAPEGGFSAVFEDDGDTGYFYALDRGAGGQPIQDALHVYDVAGVGDKHLPSEIKIGWSVDGGKVVLLINGHAHAVFDFSSKRGYCRTGFPAPARDSGRAGHAWSDDALGLFAEESQSGRSQIN